MLTDLRGAHHHGFSLIELMVAITIGLFILTGIVFIYAEIVRSNAVVLRTAHLQQTLWSLMRVIADDVRRAGYWSRSELTLDGETVNRFAPVHIIDGGCILYSYDEEKDDTDGAPNPEDQHGFRLTDGGIQMKTSDNTCGVATCTQCNSGNWQFLTNPQELRITTLTFRREEHTLPMNDGMRQIVAREMGIELEGEIAADATVRHQLNTSVSIRNHEIR